MYIHVELYPLHVTPTASPGEIGVNLSICVGCKSAITVRSSTVSACKTIGCTSLSVSTSGRLASRAYTSILDDGEDEDEDAHTLKLKLLKAEPCFTDCIISAQVGSVCLTATLFNG